jgi:Tol biopolymer transport system component
MVLGLAVHASAGAAVTTRVSVSSSGEQGNAPSESGPLSAGGRFEAFLSEASNLVPGDTNGASDVFVRNRRSGVTRRVSVSSSGEQADGVSGRPSISAGGRFVAFPDDASNLVPGDTNNDFDAFVRDRWTGTTTRVSVSSSGTQGNGASGTPSISSNGRFVAFASGASNLVPGDTNGASDVFVRDRWRGCTRRVSVSSSGRQGNVSSLSPAISANGRFVAFVSDAKFVAGDTNGFHDVFVRDRWSSTTTRVTASSIGGQGGGTSPAISADGRFVAFFAYDTSQLVAGDDNLADDAFVRDRSTGTTTRISVSPSGEQGNGSSGQGGSPSVSEDGRYVAFDSYASNLVPGDTNGYSDTFVRDLWTQTTTRISVTSAGTQGNGLSFGPYVSANGRVVAFFSYASNLVSGDMNATNDVFVRGPLS